MAKGDDRLRGRFWRKREDKERAQAAMPGQDELASVDPIDPIKADKKPGRNDPCPCGSGKKYKKCHGALRRPEG